MKNKLVGLLLAVCVISCIGGADPDPPTPPETRAKFDRYEDFTHLTTTFYKKDSFSNLLKDKVVIEFTPKKVGAYFIEVPNVISVKIIVGPGDLAEYQSSTTTQPVSGQKIEWPSTGEFWVTYSDGKCIERTTVRLDN